MGTRGNFKCVTVTFLLLFALLVSEELVENGYKDVALPITLYRRYQICLFFFWYFTGLDYVQLDFTSLLSDFNNGLVHTL